MPTMTRTDDGETLRAKCVLLRSRGLTTGQIAQRLGVTKNAVSGQLDRAQVRRPRPMVGRGYLPKSDKVALIGSDVIDFKLFDGEPEPIANPGDLPAGGCQWIHGHPGSGPWRACGHRRVPGVAYCAHHNERTKPGG